MDAADEVQLTSGLALQCPRAGMQQAVQLKGLALAVQAHQPRQEPQSSRKCLSRQVASLSH